MKQKWLLFASTLLLIAALAACSEKDANLQTVSKSFETPQSSGTAVETPAADPELTEVSDVVVTTETANIRSGPGMQYDVLDQVGANVEFERVGIAGEWSCVLYDGQTVYVNNALIEPRRDYVVEAASGYVTVTEEIANIRTGAGTGYKIVYTAAAGDRYAVTGVTDFGWYEIEYEGGKAYIYAELVEAVIDDAVGEPAVGTAG